MYEIGDKVRMIRDWDGDEPTAGSPRKGAAGTVVHTSSLDGMMRVVFCDYPSAQYDAAWWVWGVEVEPVDEPAAPTPRQWSDAWKHAAKGDRARALQWKRAYTEVCSNLQQAVHNYNLGSGGEKVDQLVIARLEELEREVSELRQRLNKQEESE